jgi:4-amino-4-deoxy-L-arabinose transferase-like glycosyltransferase
MAEDDDKQPESDEDEEQAQPDEDSVADDRAEEEAETGDEDEDEDEDEPVATEPPEPPEPKDESEKNEGDEDDVVPRGNRPNWLRGIAVAVVGAAIPFLIMSTDRRWPFSVPVGALGCLIAFFGVADMLGTFDDPAESVTARAEGAKLRSAVLEAVTAFAAWFVSLRIAVAGSLKWPIPAAALLITVSFLWLIAATFRTAQALGAYRVDENGKPRPLLERHGFWLLVIATLLYLPLLGSYSLSDPWETHYGEVAREMLARDDWISLWWAQDGWFWSKPILDFWMQGLSFSALGVHYMPDQMLAGVAHGRFPQPEWAARIGVFLLTLSGLYFLYKGVAKAWGRRVGFIGGVVLTTMPYWFLIGHQSMTDMPYVGPLTAAMGLIVLGFQTDPDQRVKVYEIAIGSRKLRLSLWHLLFGAVVLAVLPQVLYLFTRNLTLHIDAASRGFAWHTDTFWSGSGGGNCELPGNEPCKQHFAVNRSLQPWHAALLWAGLGGALLWLNRGERRVSRLCFLAGWFFVALASMAKGAPGLVLPIFATGMYVAATRRWRDLARAEVLGMVLLIVVVCLPWYVQMFMRHGQPFTDRLLFHDMYKRAFVHVHDTNVGDDTSFRYYIWQLGYGLFPWTGLGAAGLVWWLRRKNDQSDPRGDVGAFLALWFVSGFGMFTITLTKFHHYVFPVVPPIAMFVGMILDRALGDHRFPQGRRLAIYIAGLGAAVVCALYGVLRLFPGAISGREIDGHPPGAMPKLGWAMIVVGAAIAYWVVHRFGEGDADKRIENPPKPVSDTPPAETLAISAEQSYRGGGEVPALAVVSADERAYDDLIVAVVAVASSIVVLLCGRDLFTTLHGDIEGQARLMHLFTYNYRRPWPPSLDFQAILTAFTLVPAAISLLFVLPKLRAHAAVMLLCASVVWCAWGVDVYLFKAAPHWGQRETVMAYYRDRQSPNEPFVSYQMNWKGENFYTGNHTPAFVSSGQKFKDWIKEQRDKGVRTMYFTTEHGRVTGLKGEVGQFSSFDAITSPELNNKFFVARVRF